MAITHPPRGADADADDKPLQGQPITFRAKVLPLLKITNPTGTVYITGSPGDRADVVNGCLRYTQANSTPTLNPNVFTIRLPRGSPIPPGQVIISTNYPPLRVSPYVMTHTGASSPENRAAFQAGPGASPGTSYIEMLFSLSWDRSIFTCVSSSDGTKVEWVDEFPMAIVSTGDVSRYYIFSWD